MGSRPPPGCWVPKQGPSPLPGRRMAQEAFEAYGKSSPLPALPHHPFPPGYVPPPVSMGTGGSTHGTLSTMRRRGDYRQGATAAGDPGVRSLYHGEGREGPKEKPPSPRCSQVPHPVLASCLRHACNEGTTTRAPPPQTPPPPRGCARRVGGATTGDTRQPPPPAEGQVPRLVPAPCLRRACDVRATKERRQGPPPHTHTSAPPRVGDAGRGGAKSAPPPPEDKAAGWGGSGERVRDGPHDRARREHAPCKPQRGDHWGCEHRVGRATTGATRHAAPPAEGQVPRLVPAPCLRRACDMRATKGRRQAPPPHTPPPPQGWGMKVGRGGQRPPPPEMTKRQGGEAAERGCGTDHTTVPVGSTRRASPSGGGTGGANAR